MNEIIQHYMSCLHSRCWRQAVHTVAKSQAQRRRPIRSLLAISCRPWWWWAWWWWAWWWWGSGYAL